MAASTPACPCWSAANSAGSIPIGALERAWGCLLDGVITTGGALVLGPSSRSRANIALRCVRAVPNADGVALAWT